MASRRQRLKRWVGYSALLLLVGGALACVPFLVPWSYVQFGPGGVPLVVLLGLALFPLAPLALGLVSGWWLPALVVYGSGVLLVLSWGGRLTPLVRAILGRGEGG